MHTDPKALAKTEFTEKQIANWRAFEKVRKSGKFNMFDPEARKKAKLDADEYTFCMRNYTYLKAASEGKS